MLFCFLILGLAEVLPCCTVIPRFDKNSNCVRRWLTMAEKGGSSATGIILGDYSSVHIHNSSIGVGAGGSSVQQHTGSEAVPKSGGDGPDRVQLTRSICYFPKKRISKRVFHGEQTTNSGGSRRIAVKMEFWDKSILKESKILVKLGETPHQNVVSYYDSGTVSDKLNMFLAMELCYEQNLRQYTEARKKSGKPFDEKLAINHAKQVIAGMVHIHDCEIIHRDLKPDNILFSQNQKYLKISDFDLSKEIGTQSTLYSKAGTEGYRAPEVINKGSISKKADIFSLGLVLYYIWSYGEHPYGSNWGSWTHYIRTNQTPDFTNLRLKNIVGARNLLGWMLSFKPEERPSIQQVENDEVLGGSERAPEYFSDANFVDVAHGNANASIADTTINVFSGSGVIGRTADQTGSSASHVNVGDDAHMNFRNSPVGGAATDELKQMDARRGQTVESQDVETEPKDLATQGESGQIGSSASGFSFGDHEHVTIQGASIGVAAGGSSVQQHTGLEAILKSKGDRPGKRFGDVFVDDEKPLRKGYSVYKGYVMGVAGMHEEVAVKIESVAYLDELQREIKIMQWLTSHQNCVLYRHSGIVGNQVYIAMELCRRETFYEMVKMSKLHSNNATIALIQVMHGLRHIHQKKILHRDLKPKHILWSLDGKNVKISGFGHSSMELNRDATKIENFLEVGTYGWRPPEQYVEGAVMSEKSDIYSAGLVSFFALSGGKHAFGEEAYKYQFSIMWNYSIYWSALQGSDAEIERDLIMKMTAHKPEDRPTANQVLTHCFFWDIKKRMHFYHSMWEISGLLKTSQRTLNEMVKQIFDEIQNCNGVIDTKMGKKNWFERMEESAKNLTGTDDRFNIALRRICSRASPRYYDSSSVSSLIRFIRNVNVHRSEDNIFANAKQIWDFFNRTFPKLFCTVYNVVWKQWQQMQSSQDFPDHLSEFFTETAAYQPLEVEE